jgi:hypothetical protein
MSINADCAKVIKVIESCKTRKHLELSNNMRDNFYKKYSGYSAVNNRDYYACQNDMHKAMLKQIPIVSK